MKILIVEDDEAILNLLNISLTDAGYVCTTASDGKEAAALIESCQYDIILLDIMLPGINGYELLSYIRPLGTPVIFITAMGAHKDIVQGLKMGADDYIVKPFQIGEVLARIEAVMRRMGYDATDYSLFGVEINTTSRTVKKDGKPISLSMKEFDLLMELIRNKNVALYRDKLYERVWDEPFMGVTRTLDSHIQRLRKKLDWDDHIKTVFRVGYRLEV